MQDEVKKIQSRKTRLSRQFNEYDNSISHRNLAPNYSNVELKNTPFNNASLVNLDASNCNMESKYRIPQKFQNKL